MSRISRTIKDKTMNHLIREYLRSGIMIDGCVSQTIKWTPQGGLLSPLLSNIVLDLLDKELERRGHPFCRYADDCNIYVGSQRAGERVMTTITRFIEERLRQKVNREKSAVARPWHRKFLGYTVTWHTETKLRVAPKSIQRLQKNLNQLFRKGQGRNRSRLIREEQNPLLTGWINYFKLSETKGFAETLDQWIRRRLRLILWRQWKRPWTRLKNLMKQGIEEERAARSAFNQRGPWYNSGASHINNAFPKKFFDNMKRVSLLDMLKHVNPSPQETAVYGTVRTVV